MRDKGSTAIYLNIKTFNAVGDGSTNCDTAFTSAGTTTPIYVPAGDYLVTALPTGRYFGPGRIKIGSEFVDLDLGTPQRADTTLVGDVRRLNTSVGQKAGAAITSAASTSGANVALGHNALTTSTNPARMTAVGAQAMKYTGERDRSGVTVANNNACKCVAVGTDSMYASVWADSSTYVGSNAGKWTGDADPYNHAHDFFNGSGSAQLYSIDARWSTIRTDIVGTAATPSNAATTEVHNSLNVGIGRNALLHAVRSTRNSAIGYNAMAHGYNVVDTTAVGASALRDAIAANEATAVGSNALVKCASGSGNTAVGAGAAAELTHSRYNVAVGWNALGAFTDGLDGAVASLTATDGSSTSVARRNVAIGPEAMYNSSDSGSGSFRFNVAVGSQALYNTTGPANVGVGGVALQSLTSGSLNTGVGHEALQQLTTGTSNTGVGYQAGKLLQGGGNAQTVTNTTAVGAGAAVSGSNQVQLGDSATTTYVYGTVQNRSDLRDKADVRDTTLGLDFINRLRPVDYRWDMRDSYDTWGWRDGSKKRTRFHHGLIAQEVEEVIAETGVDFGGFQDHAREGGSDVKTIGYDELIAPLIKAVQELTARVEELEDGV